MSTKYMLYISYNTVDNINLYLLDISHKACYLTLLFSERCSAIFNDNSKLRACGIIFKNINKYIY